MTTKAQLRNLRTEAGLNQAFSDKKYQSQLQAGLIEEKFDNRARKAGQFHALFNQSGLACIALKNPIAQGIVQYQWKHNGYDVNLFNEYGYDAVARGNLYTQSGTHIIGNRDLNQLGISLSYALNTVYSANWRQMYNDMIDKTLGTHSKLTIKGNGGYIQNLSDTNELADYSSRSGMTKALVDNDNRNRGNLSNQHLKTQMPVANYINPMIITGIYAHGHGGTENQGQVATGNLNNKAYYLHFATFNGNSVYISTINSSKKQEANETNYHLREVNDIEELTSILNGRLALKTLINQAYYEAKSSSGKHDVSQQLVTSLLNNSKVAGVRQKLGGFAAETEQGVIDDMTTYMAAVAGASGYTAQTPIKNWAAVVKFTGQPKNFLTLIHNTMNRIFRQLKSNLYKGKEVPGYARILGSCLQAKKLLKIMKSHNEITKSCLQKGTFAQSSITNRIVKVYGNREGATTGSLIMDNQSQPETAIYKMRKLHARMPTAIKNITRGAYIRAKAYNNKLIRQQKIVIGIGRQASRVLPVGERTVGWQPPQGGGGGGQGNQGNPPPPQGGNMAGGEEQQAQQQ